MDVPVPTKDMLLFSGIIIRMPCSWTWGIYVSNQVKGIFCCSLSHICSDSYQMLLFLRNRVTKTYTIFFWLTPIIFLFSVIRPWSNLWLLASIVITMLLHITILYVPPLSVLFSVSYPFLIFIEGNCLYHCRKNLYYFEFIQSPLAGNSTVLGWVESCSLSLFPCKY